MLDKQFFDVSTFCNRTQQEVKVTMRRIHNRYPDLSLEGPVDCSNIGQCPVHDCVTMPGGRVIYWGRQAAAAD